MSPNLRRVGRFGWVVATVALCIASCWIQVENVRYRKALEQNRLLRPFTVPDGVVVPSIRGRTLAGKEAKIDYATAGRRTLFLVLNSPCIYCEDNITYWEQLSKIAGSDSETVVIATPLALDSGNKSKEVESLMRGEEPNQHILYLAGLSPEVVVGFDLRLVPETIVIDNAGRVLHAYTGVLTHAEFNRFASLL